MTEQKEPNKYQMFKTFVMPKIVREAEVNRDIKFLFTKSLTILFVQLLKDKTELLEENNLLHKQIQECQEQLAEKSKEQLGNYSFNEPDLYIAYHGIFIIRI